MSRAQSLVGRILAVVAAALALLAAGCGADELSKEEYEQKVQSEYAAVQQAFRRAGASGGSLGDLAEGAEDAQRQLREAADALDDVDAPKAVEEQNEELVRGLRGYADDMDRLIEAAEAGDAARVETFNASVRRNRWIMRIQEVVEDMQGKGYDLGAIADE